MPYVSDELWNVQDVGFLECGMFGVWGGWDVGCWGCGKFGMWDERCWGCGMFEMWNVWDVRCGMFAGMWDVDLQNVGQE